jgi:hypothetical protein
MIWMSWAFAEAYQNQTQEQQSDDLIRLRSDE